MAIEPRTGSEIQQALRDGTVTVRQLVERFVTEQAGLAPQAWISLKPTARLLAEADALDARLKDGGPALLDRLPLFGLLCGIKDNIDVAGLETTAACRHWAIAPADADAACVQRLVAAGALVAGKTNLDQFATGLVGTRSPYGAVPCSFDPSRVSGGSSSGSAYVVATGLVVFALGTDTAGSGRVPAGFNNLVGLKPTPGRVGTSGVLPACRSLDCVSVFALDIEDAERVLAVMEGPDPADAYSAFRPGPAQLKNKLRVGVPAQPVFSGDAGYPTLFAQAIAHLEALGHEVVAVDFQPLHATAELLYGGPWVAERHAVVESLLATHPQALDPTVRGVIEVAGRFSATDAFRGQYRLREAQRDSAALWQQVDLLMVPTAPGHPSFAEVDADPVGANSQLGTYTNFVNLLGWCALALPFGFTGRKLPFGVSFIAPANHDAALAAFARAWRAGLDLPLGALGRGASPAGYKGGPRPATETTLPIAVVGAHMSGLPLNGQLLERGGVLREKTTTAARYRLFQLPDSTPPKPALLAVASGGAAIALEVWDLPVSQVGSLLALIPPPLGLGNVKLADGRHVHGFLCESHALEGARDITSFGGWRAFLVSR